MLFIIAVVFALVGLSYVAYRYRAALENFIPGLKGKIWNGFVAMGSLVAAVVSYLQGVNWTELGVTPHRAALIGVVVGVVGVIIACVTKRA